MDRYAECDAKLARVRQWMSHKQAGAVLIRRRANFSWLTCGGHSHVPTSTETGAAALVITPDRQYLVASNIELDRLMREQANGLPFEPVGFPWHQPQQQAQRIADLIGSARLASDVAPCDIPADDDLKQLRATLEPGEIQRLRELGKLTSQITEDVCRWLKPGHSEFQIAAEVYRRTVAHGAYLPVCLIAADDRITHYRHPVPTTTVVKHRAMVVVCIERHGLICSATRLVNFVPLTNDLRRRHDAVCAIDAAAARATQIGRPFNEIFADIITAYARAGFPDEWQQHHQGGSTGYQPRDTIANAHATAIVQPNQLFAWNPSIAGTKCEDTMLITPQGPIWITAPAADWPSSSHELANTSLRCADILIRT